MAKETEISWCDSTFNFWEGCTKVSPGCTNCYAEARNNRFHHGKNWGKGAPRLLRSDAYRKEPRKWEAMSYRGRFRQCPECGWRGDVPSDEMDCPTTGCSCAGLDMFCVRPRVFSASLSDWLDDEVPIEWLADLLKLIHDTPNLDWQLLTKRPQNWRPRITAAGDHVYETGEGPLIAWLADWGDFNVPPHNVWIGTSVEDKKRADERIPELVKIPARVRFLSCEPLLEAVSLDNYILPTLRDAQEAYQGRSTDYPRIHWTIWGGESGPSARACNIDWIAGGVRECRKADVPSFVKQLGSNAQTSNANLYDWPDKRILVDSCCIEGFAAAGLRTKNKKGGDMSEWPHELQIREFPK